MDVTCSVLSALRSIFDSVRFNIEHLAEKYPPQRGITVAEKVESSPKRLKVEEVNRDVQLEALTLILKLWLRRIHLTEEEGRRALRNFEAEINLTQKNVIEPYKATLLSSESKEPEELLMGKLDKSLERACTRLLTEMKKTNFEMLEEDQRRLNMESAFVSSLLGLKLDFLDCLEEMEPEFRDHWTLKEWIVTFLQNNYRSMETRDKTSPTKDLLGEMGFDPSSAAIETILKRADEMQHHIEACAWAEIFIADEFKYNPLLSPFVPKFSVGESSGFHLPNKPGEESENGEQQCQLKPEIVSFVWQEQADFLGISQDVPFVPHAQGSIGIHARDFLRDRGLSDDQRYMLLFHGTDHQSAANILNRGIYLPAGRQKRDFSSGKGFYVTTSLDHAFKWARSTTSKPAILTFQVERNDLLNAKKLDLTSNVEEWKKTVHYFRSDEGPVYIGKEITKAYDLIEGPMATASSSSETSDQLMWQPKHSSYQLCLISDEFAKKFSQTLHLILLL
ncbi:uncharacterized protein LOC110064346 [Orbicella faveolata]|uniref:uncharacterized protein LOC110064346 n=1 Tax=Orbicella faveolata TaxID=48498 RepID=UPI0009E5314F|nr:uncharacterized protein LOC110064346 [Orbicella faveolata]